MIEQQTRLWAIKMVSDNIVFCDTNKHPLLYANKFSAVSGKRFIEKTADMDSSQIKVVEVKIVEIE